MTIQNKKEFIIEWTSTIVLIVGVTLTAWNVYPLNVWFSIAGNFGWLIVGFIWKKWSLIVIQVVVTAIYLIGLWSKGVI